jgi:hypothetical protein
MPPLRPEEEWARQVMEAELGVQVVQHDDGSRPGMHDLDAVFDDGRRAAVEVTSVVDAEQTELWNLVNGTGRWVEPDLAGGWGVWVTPSTRVRQLRRDLPSFLQALEQAGIRRFPDPASTAPVDVPPAGVVRIRQSATEFPGSVYVHLELPNDQVAAFIADTGDPVAAWLGDFLHDDARADVRNKLGASGADERHAFVVVSGLSGESFAVTGVLVADETALPTHEPRLPAGLTDVWVASVWSRGLGLRWSSVTRSWHGFDKRPPDEAAEA